MNNNLLKKLGNLFQIRKHALSLIGFCLISSLYLSPALAKNYEFGVIGDTAYFPDTEFFLNNLIADMNNKSVGAIVHVGDIQALQSCSDSTYDRVIKQFNTANAPFIYTPGDNDWTDCWGVDSHPIPPLRNPLDALASLRVKFYPTVSPNNPNSQGTSLGAKPISLIRQSKDGDNPNTPFDESKFVENQMWVRSDILFATFHIVGSNDNCVQFAIGGTVADGSLSNVPDSCSAEKRERTAANLAWLKQAFIKAKQEKLKGIALFTQMNMHWEVHRDDGSCIPVGELRQDGIAMTPEKFNQCKLYETFQVALGQEAKAYGKPVALMWGDSHFFRAIKPIPNVSNLVGVQTTGSPNFGWVRVAVDPNASQLFNFSVGSCTSGGAVVLGSPPREYCQDTYLVRVTAPTENKGNFEGFELGLINPLNGNKASGVSVNALPNETFSGEVAYVGRGCPDPDGDGAMTADAYLANPDGKIALMDRGGCFDDNKVAWAEKNGAIGAIIANTQDEPLFTLVPGGTSPVLQGSPAVRGWEINIPAFGVYKTVADKNLKSSGGPVSITVSGLSSLLKEVTQLHGSNN